MHMNMLKHKKFAALFLVIVIFTAACASGGERITAGLSPAELIQRAQDASDHNRYNLAIQYYQALLDRNQTSIDLVCTGEYEIAFIHYKQKKYERARNELNTLLERYNTPDAELLPQKFKRLSLIVLDNISKKEQRGLPLSPKKQKGG